MSTILLVEDDQALAMGIEYALREEKYDVQMAADCRSARLDVLRAEGEVDAILLDVMLPDGNGYELLQEFRGQGILCPVIFLTAVSDEGNVVRGLDLGADDYITKPFRVRELMSRLRAVLRRSAHVNDSAKALNMSDGIMLDTERTEAWLLEDGEKRALNLTKSEYRLLHFLMKNKGKTLTRSMLLERLFDDGSTFVDDNTLSVYINRLREKIGDTERETPYIQTVRGVGYRFLSE
ncbi:MAG: response regulator transcription factor [Eubacterium sp.]|nr:response regulator transcription factor [Eubacterium sp.]